MKILVTGANGMLGQDLCPILEDEGHEVIETDVDALDITNIDSVKNVLLQMQPDVVVHCAAYTNVNKAEEDLEKATLINVKGVENVAKISEEIGATIVYISTDYVFDGEKSSPYKPLDKPNPLNAYGKTKYDGELAVQKNCSKYYILRTSWLYGHHGKNFVETMLSMKDKPELKVVDDQIGCPTWTVELANFIADVLEEQPDYGIFHVCGSGKTSWYGFAKEIFEQMGLRVNLKPCDSNEFPSPAKRPHYSVIDNGLCRDWKAALKDYLELRSE